ncbi:MAG: PH domain-containing protein [Ignavibacteria bacterium]|nr:PH domain-containing protein [Ignavibacteria bacterium]
MEEKTESLIWEGSQSQVLNLGVFLSVILVTVLIVIISLITLPLLMVLCLIPLGYGLWKWLVIKFNRYKITTQRIFYSTGIFTKKTDVLELYRVMDLNLYEPFWQRIFGLGIIELSTSDETTPKFVLKAVPKPADLSDKIRKSVESRRDAKRVRGIEFLDDELTSNQ